MTINVETTIEIDRPVDVVAAYSADPTNAPEWYEKIESIDWETEPVVAIGSKAAFVAHFLRKRLAYTYEIVEFESGRKLVMTTAHGPFPMTTTYEWSPTGDGTTMTLRNEGVPAGFSAIFKPFMAMAMRRANRNDLAALKSILEG